MLVTGRSDEAALAALRLPQPRNASVEVSPRPLRGTGTHRRPRGATLGEGLTNGTRRPVELNLRAARFPSVRIPTATDSERNGTERHAIGTVDALATTLSERDRSDPWENKLARLRIGHVYSVFNQF